MQTTSVSLLKRLKQAPANQDWQRFVEIYAPLLFHWVRTAGVDPPDDADVVQDVFALLLEKLPQFEYDAGKSFRGWLHRLVVNKSRDRLRLKGLRYDPDPPSVSNLADPRGHASAWEQEHHAFLAAMALKIMRSEFQATTWKACWEFVVVGRPAAEIAAEMGISENGVYVAKCRVMRRLRKELAGLLD